MTKGDAERRAEKLESHPEGSRRKRREEGLGASRVTARREYSGPEIGQLMEAVVERENMWSALKQVERNRGAAGALAENQRGTVGRQLSPAAGAEGRDTKAWRQRNARLGHSDGDRPTDSTGAAPSLKSHL